MFQEHLGFYGAPRIHQELRVCRASCRPPSGSQAHPQGLAQGQNPQGVQACSKTSTGAGGAVEKLLQQEFQPPATNRCWAGDITYIRSSAAGRYLDVWIDIYSRRVVGWKLDQRMDASLVIEDLNRGLGHRWVEPATLLIHTDQGSPIWISQRRTQELEFADQRRCQIPRATSHQLIKVGSAPAQQLQIPLCHACNAAGRQWLHPG